MISTKRRPASTRDIIREAKRYGAPEASKRQRIYSNYVALTGNLIDEEPTCFEEDSNKKEWMKAMIEEYQSVINNDVWDVVPRPKDKSLCSLKWTFKTRNLTNGSIEKFKEIFVA